jgi:hypothetical protein
VSEVNISCQLPLGGTFDPCSCCALESPKTWAFANRSSQGLSLSTQSVSRRQATKNTEQPKPKTNTQQQTKPIPNCKYKREVNIAVILATRSHTHTRTHAHPYTQTRTTAHLHKQIYKPCTQKKRLKTGNTNYRGQQKGARMRRHQANVATYHSKA